MSEPTQIVDHTDRGLGVLASQYRGKPVVTWLLEAFYAEVQELEDAFWALYSRKVETASGATLTLYGNLAGTAQDGFSETLFRRRILAEFLVNRSSGKIDDLTGLLGRLVDSAYTIEYREYYPAQASLTFFETSPSEAWRAILTPTLQRAASAGVLIDPVIEAGSAEDPGGVFGYLDADYIGGYDVGGYATVTGGTRTAGRLFYVDLARGYYELCPLVDAGGVCLEL